MLILTFSVVASAPVFADSISYNIDFTKYFGRTVSDGSFEFNSPGHSDGVIPHADFVDLEARVGHVLYTASSPADDFALVSENGIVRGLFADLEPNGPFGDVLQLYPGQRHQYILWDADMDSILGRGTYDVDVEKMHLEKTPVPVGPTPVLVGTTPPPVGTTPVPEPSSFSLLALSGALLWGGMFIMRSRRGVNAVPSR
jgi:hypothetical protein